MFQQSYTLLAYKIIKVNSFLAIFQGFYLFKQFFKFQLFLKFTGRLIFRTYSDRYFYNCKFTSYFYGTSGPYMTSDNLKLEYRFCCPVATCEAFYSGPGLYLERISLFQLQFNEFILYFFYVHNSVNIAIYTDH